MHTIKKKVITHDLYKNTLSIAWLGIAV